MKNILCATDLSVAAAAVTDYAAWLAGVAGARLTLMSAYRVAPVLAASSVPEMPDEGLPELVQCRLEEAATRLGAQHRLVVDVLARSGDPVRSILAAARDIHADLIVLGKAGPRRTDPMAFGATVAALARKTTVPLLIVPQRVDLVVPKAIAITKELYHDEIHGLLREFLGRFCCRLFLFGVETKEPGETVEVYRSDAIHSTGEFFNRLYEIPVDTRLRHSIENFIETAPIHWLAVRPLAGLAPERWVLNGRNKDLAFDIRVPLLVLPGAEATDGGKRSA